MKFSWFTFTTHKAPRMTFASKSATVESRSRELSRFSGVSAFGRSASAVFFIRSTLIALETVVFSQSICFGYTAFLARVKNLSHCALIMSPMLASHVPPSLDENCLRWQLWEVCMASVKNSMGDALLMAANRSWSYECRGLAMTCQSLLISVVRLPLLPLVRPLYGTPVFIIACRFHEPPWQACPLVLPPMSSPLSS